VRGTRAALPQRRAMLLELLGSVVAGGRVEADQVVATQDLIRPRLRPLVAYALGRDVDRLPSDLADLLRTAERAASIRHLARNEVVRRLHEGLGASSIEGIFLKGVALAEQVYPAPHLRPMGDIDVWVPEDAVDHVEVSLAAHGFRVPKRYQTAHPHHGVVPTIALETTFGISPFFVEVHGLPASVGAFPARVLTEIRRRAVELESGLRVLSPGDQMIHLCAHLTFKSPFSGGLPALVDVALLARRLKDDSDWDQVQSLAERTGRSGSTWAVLRLVRDMLEAPVPTGTLDELEPKAPAEVLDMAAGEVWFQAEPLPAGLEHALGGGLSRTEWVKGRTLGVHGREVGVGRLAVVTAIARDTWTQLGRYMDRLRRGVFFRRAFWTSMIAAPRRGRLLRILRSLDRDA